MNSRRNECADEVRPFECFLCHRGCVCLWWHRTLPLHFARGDVPQALECLEGVLQQPSGSFCLVAGPFCVCRAADGFCYLECQDRVVLGLSTEDAHSLYATLASFGAGLEPPERRLRRGDGGKVFCDSVPECVGKNKKAKPGIAFRVVFWVSTYRSDGRIECKERLGVLRVNGERKRMEDSTVRSST